MKWLWQQKQKQTPPSNAYSGGGRCTGSRTPHTVKLLYGTPEAILERLRVSFESPQVRYMDVGSVAV